jgi:hypothetical protein
MPPPTKLHIDSYEPPPEQKRGIFAQRMNPNIPQVKFPEINDGKKIEPVAKLIL